MVIRDITEQDKKDFNSIVTHPLQSFEWGEFREKTGIKIIRRGFFEKEKIVDGFQLTIHKIPKTPWNIGYLPKGNLPTPEIIEELKKIGKQEKCVFIQLEPNLKVENGKLSSEAGSRSAGKFEIKNLKLIPSAHPLFTKYTFILDLTQSEEELLQNMHHKTRYNIKVAQKNNVEVVEDNSDDAFEEYLKLTQKTTERQGFYAHTEKYHRLMWKTLRNQKSKIKNQKLENEMENGTWKIENLNKLNAHLLLAKYKDQILVSWILFTFKDTLYYPYGASSSEYRNVMASNLMMWEAIKYGKKLGLKKFDMWGSLGTNPSPKDPWFGFHKFKEGYGATLTEFAGSYDLVINPYLYEIYKVVDKIRWTILKLRK